jgi:AcrR family transcriptional regulator
LLEVALERLEVDRAASANLRKLNLHELARAAGISHRTVNRQFPDQPSLMAWIAEAGWRRLIEHILNETAGKTPDEATLVACGVEFFLFARGRPNLFHLMMDWRVDAEDEFPDLAAAMANALAIFAQGFTGLGLPPETARERAAVFLAALQGVTAQILHRQLRVAPAKTRSFVADVCKRLIKGLR